MSMSNKAAAEGVMEALEALRRRGYAKKTRKGWVITPEGRAAIGEHSPACMTTRLLSGDPSCPACGDKAGG